MDKNASSPAEDANTHATADAAGSPSGSLEVHDTALNEHEREEWAATRIQKAFRGFLVLIPIFHLLSMSNENLKYSLSQVVWDGWTHLTFEAIVVVRFNLLYLEKD